MPRSTRETSSGLSRHAAGLFAATVVLTVGGGTCLMAVFLAAPELVAPVACVFGGLIAMVILWRFFADGPLRRARDTNLYFAERERLDQFVATFNPKARRRGGRDLGNNKPPSADDLRKIREDANVWCPSERRAEEYRRNLRGGH